MPYYPRLNILYTSIPCTASDEVNKTLITHEIFDGEQQPEEVYNKLIYESKYKKREDFKHHQTWEMVIKYPQAFDSKQFCVVRNPYERAVCLFFDLTKTSKYFIDFLPHKNDSIKTIQRKFEDFFVQFKMFKNFNQGIGIEHIEFLLYEFDFPDKEKMGSVFFKNTLFQDTRLSLQLEMIRTDFRKNLRFFGQKYSYDLNRPEVIKYEELEKSLKRFSPQIFKNFKLTDNKSFRSKSGVDYPLNFFYNKRTRLLVGEYYEPDFDFFHYSPKLDLIRA